MLILLQVILEMLGVTGVIILGVALLGIGIAGCILPALPGPSIALVAPLALELTIYDFSWYTWVILCLLTIVATLGDYVIPILGTKKYGGTQSGVRGSMIGLLLGVIASFSIPVVGFLGVILGPFLGAYVGEKYAGTENKQAWRSAFGSLMGFLAGTAGKLMVTFIIAFFFLWGVVRYFILVG